MKLWTGIFLCLCLNIAATTQAAPLDKSIQVDVTMAKITTLFQANREAEALPYFSQLEAMDTPLPESFYFYYIDALEKSGDKKSALSRAEAYLNRYGKKGKYYSNVVTVLSRLSIQIDKETKEKAAADALKAKELAAEFERKSKQYNQQLAQYEKSVENCPNRFSEHVDYLEKESLAALAYCQKITRGYCNPERDTDFVAKRKKFLFTRRDGVEAYCDNRYTKPEKPAVLR